MRYSLSSVIVIWQRITFNSALFRDSGKHECRRRQIFRLLSKTLISGTPWVNTTHRIFLLLKCDFSELFKIESTHANKAHKCFIIEGLKDGFIHWHTYVSTALSNAFHLNMLARSSPCLLNRNQWICLLKCNGNVPYQLLSWCLIWAALLRTSFECNEKIMYFW